MSDGYAAARDLAKVQGPNVQRRACRLCSFVHGHSFLHTDMTTKGTTAGIGERYHLTVISRAVLAPTARTHS